MRSTGIETTSVTYFLNDWRVTAAERTKRLAARSRARRGRINRLRGGR